jgi:hypothetical protein
VGTLDNEDDPETGGRAMDVRLAADTLPFPSVRDCIRFKRSSAARAEHVWAEDELMGIDEARRQPRDDRAAAHHRHVLALLLA